ncbi:MAG TPA: winged helix-turn-helix domain-containing protein [Pyrinomonadaceae bacterium]
MQKDPKRLNGPQGHNYSFGDFELDPVMRRLLRSGEVAPLYSKAFDLLLALVENSGRDLSKDELLETVWPGQVLEESNLSVNMSAVRRALGETAAAPKYIVTIPGHGYRFVGPVTKFAREMVGVVIETETIAQIAIEEEEDEPPALPRASTTRRASVIRLFLILGVPAIVSGIVLSLVVWKIKHGSRITNQFIQTKTIALTNNGDISNAALSPDGKFFVYVQGGRGKDRGKHNLYLAQVNGEKPIELSPLADVVIRGVEFNKDGDAVYYSSEPTGQGSFALYKLSVLGGVPAKLRDNIGGDFALSPDTKRVAFIRDNGDNTRSVVVSNLDGTNERALLTVATNQVSSRCISWSPDGASLAFVSRTIEKDESLEVSLLPLQGGKPDVLTKPLWREITRITYLKNGSGLLLIGAAVDPTESRQVWLVASPSGDARRVTSDASLYGNGLSVSADGKSFLVHQIQQINNLWVSPADNLSKSTQVTFTTLNTVTGNFAFDWTPDDHIVYAGAKANGLNLWTMNSDGQDVKELTQTGGFDSDPSVTADGRFVVFHSTRSGGDEIWRIDRDGSNPLRLTNCGKNAQPSVSPDGKWVVHISTCENNVRELRRVSIDGGESKRLVDGQAFWPWVSPDSKWIACGYLAAPGKWQLAIVPIDGGAPAKLFDVPPLATLNFALRWTRDGKYVTYRDWAQGLWRQNISGGPPERIPGLPEEKIYCYGWSPDNKWFAYSRGVENQDLYLVRDVGE